MRPDTTGTYVREHGPVEQGLRHLNEWKHRHNVLAVREHGPVEQGLRLQSVFFVVKQTCVREHGPVEQGLRLGHPFCGQFPLGTSQRAWSSRTRIKTIENYSRNKFFNTSESMVQ